jgi:glycosyltransferase involved in cell wall biosynthesis
MFKPYQLREQLALSLTVPDVHLISLQPSLEGLIVPSKFYGIAAAGRPTIFVGDRYGEIPRILRETGSGYTVSVGDSVGLANRILEMSRDVETMNMGVRARLTFDQHFDQRHAFAAWEELLHQASASP